MLQERLLERLRFIERDPDHRGVADQNRVITSILRHLQKILNTRQGSVLIDSQYGLPDFTDLAATFSSESVRELLRAIKAAVTRYEPRLTSVHIEVESAGEKVLELRFKIEASMVTSDNVQVPVAFETAVDPRGHIQINT